MCGTKGRRGSCGRQTYGEAPTGVQKEEQVCISGTVIKVEVKKKKKKSRESRSRVQASGTLASAQSND